MGVPRLLGIPEEVDEESPIKDYAAEAQTYPGIRSRTIWTSTSTSATAACGRSVS